MSSRILTITVANSREAFPRVVPAVHDRGDDIQSLEYKRLGRDRAGLLTLTTRGGGGNLVRHLCNIIGVLDVESYRYVDAGTTT